MNNPQIILSRLHNIQKSDSYIIYDADKVRVKKKSFQVVKCVYFMIQAKCNITFHIIKITYESETHQGTKPKKQTDESFLSQITMDHIKNNPAQQYGTKQQLYQLSIRLAIGYVSQKAFVENYPPQKMRPLLLQLLMYYMNIYSNCMNLIIIII